jgi:hypothetical protein
VPLATDMFALSTAAISTTNDQVDAFLTNTIDTSLKGFMEAAAAVNFYQVRVHIDLQKNPRSITENTFTTITSLNRSLNSELPSSLTVLNGVGHIWLDKKYQIYTDFQDAIADFVVQLETEGFLVGARIGSTMADLIIDWNPASINPWDNDIFTTTFRQFLRNAGPFDNTETPQFDFVGDGGDNWGA